MCFLPRPLSESSLSNHGLISLLGQAISFIVGFVLQDIKLALYVGLLGTALTFVVVVPPWPFFNNHPVKWLPAGSGF